MDKNIRIPLSLFNRILEMLEYWDVPEYASHFRQDYEAVLSALRKKKQAMELRETYVKIINAEDDDTRHDARMQYLQQKRWNKGFF